MRHIAYLIPTIDRIGGAEQQMLLLARGMLKRGWRVSIIAIDGTGGDFASILQSKGAAFLTLNMQGLLDPRGWLRLQHWIKNERPDVLHAHLPQAALLARWSRLAAPIPVLIDTIHSPEVGSRTRKLAYRASIWQPDLVTSVSQATAAPWLANKLIVPDRFAVIPNGIDLNRWKRGDEIRPTIRSQFKLDDRFVWLSVGRLHPVKDHATLLRAMSMLPDRTSLVIAGTGLLQQELRNLSRRIGIERRVAFLGFEPDVRRWLRAADAFVLSSRSEGLPLALLEASACELPSVTTDLPSVREIFPDRDARFMASVGEPRALAAAMEHMMSLRESDRRELGEAARQRVAEKFNLDSVLDQWEATYTSLLQQNHHPQRFGRSAASVSTFLVQ